MKSLETIIPEKGASAGAKRRQFKLQVDQMLEQIEALSASMKADEKEIEAIGAATDKRLAAINARLDRI